MGASYINLNIYFYKLNWKSIFIIKENFLLSITTRHLPAPLY